MALVVKCSETTVGGAADFSPFFTFLAPFLSFVSAPGNIVQQ